MVTSSLRLAQAVGDRARGMADLQAQIPEEIEHELDRAGDFRAACAAGEEQQINVGERCQRGAAIAAGGRHGEPVSRLDRRHRQRIAEQGIDQLVHQPRMQPGRGQAVQPVAFETLLHMGLEPPELSAEGAQSLVARRWIALRHQSGQGSSNFRRFLSLRHLRHGRSILLKLETQAALSIWE